MESSYKKLALALAINTVLMFFITYAMIDELSHLHANVNRAYMAILMAAPMGIVMLLVMGSMYRNAKLNRLLFGMFAAAILLTFAGMRTQTPIGNEQFLHSMIPHHSSAIVMCERASITDPEIERLCEEIVRAQKDEIAQMEGMLERY